MKRVLSGMMVLVGMGWAAEAGADIYRYVDAKGVIHFSNAPNAPHFKLFMKEDRDSRPLESGFAPVSRERLQKFDPLIQQAAGRHGLDHHLVMAVIKVESDFVPSAVSSKGAQGLMQLMPGTARDLGVRNAFDPTENMDGGVRHLRSLLEFFKGNLQYALAAYNAGRDAVLQHRGIPPYPETQQYVKMVLHYYDRFQREMAQSRKVQAASLAGAGR